MTATYVKLQDAYVAEQAAMGNWKRIGYAMKNGDTFDYSQTSTMEADGASVLVESLGDGVEGWRATTKVKLNDCGNASYWTITVSAAGNSAQGMVNYTTGVQGDNCAELTPSFSKLSSNN